MKYINDDNLVVDKTGPLIEDKIYRLQIMIIKYIRQ